MPAKDGTSSSIPRLDHRQWAKVIELELSNMEGAPLYTLTHQLSIGSEIGNIVVANPTVSPRHCTFILQQDLVSVLDHGSVEGTWVNGQKIPSGKYIILEDSDAIAVGELEVRIRVKRVVVEPVPLVDAPIEVDISLPDTMIEPEPAPEPAALELEAEVPPPVKTVRKNKMPNPPKFTHAKKNLDAKYSANSLIRVIAVTCDLLLAYSILVVFLPFDDFRNFLEFIPAAIADLIGVEWQALRNSITKDFPLAGEVANDLFKFFSGTFQIGYVLLVFILLRLLSTLLMGVSISEFILGMRGRGNGIWIRIGGVLRVIIGIFTWPFLIFDIPSIISRKTFKEFITFTNTQLSSTFLALIGTILYLPFLVAMALISPLFQGFEPAEPILINNNIEQRVKVAKDSEEQEGQAAKESRLKRDVSRFLGLELAYEPKMLNVIPAFKFMGKNKKLNLNGELIFYDRDLQKPVHFELYKTFDLKQLLGIGIKSNVFLFDRFPEIRKFVYTADEHHPAFKAARGPREHALFATEFIDFTKFAFELSFENVLEVMQAETMLIKGPMEYKSSLLSLLGEKNFDQINFIKLGNGTFMRVTFRKDKNYDYILPLVAGEGKIYKVSFGDKEDLNSVSNKFYKYALDSANWFPAAAAVIAARQPSEIMSPLQVVDFVASLAVEKKIIQPERAQALYGYYFEQSAAVLQASDDNEYEVWKNSVISVSKILEGLEYQGEAEAEEVRSKLLHNFRDLKEAIEARNKEYFGITKKVSI